MKWKKQPGGSYLSDRGYIAYRWQVNYKDTGKWKIAWPGEWPGGLRGGQPTLLCSNLPFDTLTEAKKAAEQHGKKNQ